MKKGLLYLAAVLSSFAILSCAKEDEILTDASLTASANQIILVEDQGESEALLLTWEDFAPGQEYTVMIANLYSVGWGNTWQKTVSGTSLSISVAELENALLGIGRESGSDAYIKIMVQAGTDGSLGSTVISSAVVRLYIPSVVLKAPEITANTTAVTLAEATKLEKALELTWTDASVEGELCTYEIEFAAASDTEFANPIHTETLSSKSAFWYQLDLNIMLLQAGFTLGQDTPLIYRIKAIPVNAKVKGNVSETQNLSVTSYTRPVPAPDFVQSIYIAGSGVPSQWSIPSDKGKFEETKPGIWEWTGTISDRGGTFKVLFNGGWKYGFRHGVNDYYWEDAQFVDNIGDNDYGVVLAKGTYKITVDVNKGTLSREIIKADRTEIGITECKSWHTVNIPSINESNTVFQGNVTLTSEDGFIVVLGDGNRNYVRNTKDPVYGTRWKMSERRAKSDDNEKYWFHAPETRSYLVTVDIQNNILTLE